MKTILATLALALLPMGALAEGCPHETRAASCPQGQSWDAATKACIVMSS